MNFVPNLTGTLIRIEEDSASRFRFEIWFDYTRQNMNLIGDGAMLAVPNFASGPHQQHYSILEVVTILPMHYALGDNANGYPGFVMAAAENAANDWEEQENEATEDTTKIRCIAIPTNMEWVSALSNGKSWLQTESKLPMLGAKARLFDTSSTQLIANYGITEAENTLLGGVLQRDEKVSIRVRIEELLRTHFGIFGFTGAGKSNLLSTLITRVLTENQETAKVAFFDLMGEYTALLIDQLLRDDIDAYVVCLDNRTLPQPTFRYLNKETNARLDDAVRAFSRYTLLPKALKSYGDEMTSALGRLLQQERVKVFSATENLTLYTLFFDGNNQKSPSNTKARQKQLFVKRTEALKKFASENGGTQKPLDVGRAKSVLANLKTAVEQGGALKEFAEDMTGVITSLEDAIPKLEEQLKCGISFDELLRLLNNPESSSLVIFNAHDPNELRLFAKRLGEHLYDSRRRSGEIEPLVSFVFDEADEFIPMDAKNSYEASSEIAMTIARRGRKFGLGIGIATQRVRYLNTSIMAQPHTYFVSKMPRSSDRTVVADAFGVSEEMFRQTFKFKKGDWLLMSHDATGLEAIPLPIHSEDANVRLIKFLQSDSTQTD